MARFWNARRKDPPLSRRANLQENEFYDIITSVRYEENYELSLSSFVQLRSILGNLSSTIHQASATPLTSKLGKYVQSVCGSNCCWHLMCIASVDPAGNEALLASVYQSLTTHPDSRTSVTSTVCDKVRYLQTWQPVSNSTLGSH